MFLVLRIPVRKLARLLDTTRSWRLTESTMLRGFGATVRTISQTQLRTFVDVGSLPLRHCGAAPIPKQQLQSEVFSLFLRLLLLLEQNRLLAKVQLLR